MTNATKVRVVNSNTLIKKLAREIFALSTDEAALDVEFAKLDRKRRELGHARVEKLEQLTDLVKPLRTLTEGVLQMRIDNKLALIWHPAFVTPSVVVMPPAQGEEEKG